MPPSYTSPILTRGKYDFADPRRDRILWLPLRQIKSPKDVVENINVSEAMRDRRFVEVAELFLGNLVRSHILKRPEAPDPDVKAFLHEPRGSKNPVALDTDIYLVPRCRARSLDGVKGVFRWLVNAAQDYTMAPQVIGSSIGGVVNLAPVLFDFDPVKVNQQYPDAADWNPLLDEIIHQLRPTRQIRRERNSFWPRFCRSIISGAEFLCGFKTASQFYEWLDERNGDEQSRIRLPREIASRIFGIGDPLACMFLMEIGFPEFAKADVHVIKIIRDTGLISPKQVAAHIACAEDAEVLYAVLRIAANAGATPYKVDRILWLIGSGNFWLDQVKIGGRRDEFIAHAHRELDGRNY